MVLLNLGGPRRWTVDRMKAAQTAKSVRILSVPAGRKVLQFPGGLSVSDMSIYTSRMYDLFSRWPLTHPQAFHQKAVLAPRLSARKALNSGTSSLHASGLKTFSKKRCIRRAAEMRRAMSTACCSEAQHRSNLKCLIFSICFFRSGGW
jgi:hypothetical protein